MAEEGVAAAVGNRGSCLVADGDIAFGVVVGAGNHTLESLRTNSDMVARGGCRKERKGADGDI